MTPNWTIDLKMKNKNGMKQQHYFNMIKYSKIKQIRRNINHVMKVIPLTAREVWLAVKNKRGIV